MTTVEHSQYNQDAWFAVKSRYKKLQYVPYNTLHCMLGGLVGIKKAKKIMFPFKIIVISPVSLGSVYGFRPHELRQT